jgi:predicted MFS family arabinose efflux permease
VNKSSRPPVSEKMVIFILFCLQFTHVLDFVIIMPLGPKFLRYFNIGPQEFALVVSSYGFASAVGGILSSFFIDRFDRKKALAFLYTGFTIGTFLCALSPSHYSLIFARAIAGGFGGVMGALLFSVIGDVIPEERRGRATGAVMSAFGVSSVIGIPLGLFIADQFDWHMTFVFIGTMSIFILVLLFKVFPEMSGHKTKTIPGNKLNDFISLLTEPNHIRVFLLTITVMFSGFLVIPFVSPYMVKNVGLSEKELGYIYFIGGGFTLITSRIIGIFSDKLGKHKVFYIVGLLSIIPVLIVTHLPKLPLVIVLCATSLFFIFVSGRFVPVMALVTSSVDPSKRGQFMGLNSALQSISMGIASSVSGLILGTNLNGEITGYGVVGIISALLTLLCLFLASKIKVHRT